MTPTPAVTVCDVRVTVDGSTHTVRVEPRRTLVDVLRRDLRLTGTQVGCEQGDCGSCTVLLDGDPVRSCLVLAAEVDCATVETVDGLASGDRLSPLQQSFADHHALQCGFCTAGFLMLGTDIVRRGGPADRAALREELSANLCRCTGYSPIVDAVAAVVAATHEGASTPPGLPSAVATGTGDDPGAST